MFEKEKEKHSSGRFGILKILEYVPFVPQIIRLLFRVKDTSLAVSCFGLKFPNPLGVAAGVDRNGEFYNILANYGPSFVEIGPMRDVLPAIKNLQKEAPDTIVFANLGNSDIERSFSLIYDFVDAIVLNISNHSTISMIVDRLVTLRRYNDTYCPIILKASAEMGPEQLAEGVELVLANGLDGMMAPAKMVKDVIALSNGLFPVIAADEFTEPQSVLQALSDGARLVAVRSTVRRISLLFFKKVLKFLRNEYSIDMHNRG